MKILLKLEHLQQRAPLERPGFVEAWLTAGKIEGDYLVLPDDAYQRLVATFGVQARCATCGD